MSPSFLWMPGPLVHAAGWALVHFLWQGTALALLWALLRPLLKHQNPKVRYAVACGVFALMAAAPVWTFLEYNPASPEAGPTPVSSASPLVGPTRLAWLAPAAAPAGLPDLLQRLGAACETSLPWCVAGWALGVGLLSLRLVHGFWSVQALSRSPNLRPLPEWVDRLRELQRRFRIRSKVSLMSSALVRVPTVVGWLRPVILVPASSLAGLSPAQMELILAHELAHIHRLDHWVNLFQALVETVLFYHPAVWWLSAEIRAERELCCDDLAVQACGDRVAYAQALAALETTRSATGLLVLGADGGSLLKRIRHIAGLSDPTPGSARGQSAGRTLLGLGLALFAAGVLCVVLSPRKYAAACRVCVNPTSPDAALADLGTRAPAADYLVETELELMRSEAVLRRALLALQVTKPATTNVSPGTTGTTLGQLRDNLRVRRLGKSAVVEITTLANSPEDATRLADAVAMAYKDRRAADESNQRGIDQLTAELNRQQETVNQQQKAMDAMKRELLVPDIAANGEKVDLTLNAETLSKLEGQRISSLAEARSLEELTRGLAAIQGTDKSAFAHAFLAAFPDTELQGRVTDLRLAEALQAAQRVELGPDHPTIQRLSAVRTDLERQVGEQAEALSQGLWLRIAAKKAEAESLAQAIQDAKQRDAELIEKLAPYFAKRKDLEHAQQIRDAVLMRILNEKVNSLYPSHNPLEILDAAAASTRPVCTLMSLGLGLCASGFLSGLGGATLLARSRRPAPQPVAV